MVGNNKALLWTAHKSAINIFIDIQKLTPLGAQAWARGSAQHKRKENKQLLKYIYMLTAVHKLHFCTTLAYTSTYISVKRHMRNDNN